MVQAAKKAYGQSASLDCHLTQALVRRFMKGDELSDALLADVEKHLAVCADCMAVANGSTKPLAERKELPPVLTQALSILQQPKHLMMLGGLAVVLVLMGTVLRNPTSVLGPKVGVAKAEEPVEEPKHSTKKSVEEETAPAPKAQTKEEAKEEPKAAEPAPPIEAESTPSSASALEGLQAADPAEELAVEPKAVEPPAKVNEGAVEVAKKADVIVVREAPRRAKPRAVRKTARVRPKAKPQPKAPVKVEKHVVVAPRKAAPKTVVTVYDEHGRPLKP